MNAKRDLIALALLTEFSNTKLFDRVQSVP